MYEGDERPLRAQPRLIVNKADASRQRVRQEFRLRDLLSHRFMQLVEETLPAGEFQRIVDGVASREIDPYSAAADVMRRVAAQMVASTGDVRRP